MQLFSSALSQSTDKSKQPTYLYRATAQNTIQRHTLNTKGLLNSDDAYPYQPTLLTFVALPLALRETATSARLSRASFMSRLLASPPHSAGSSWLAHWFGMVSHWLSSHFLEYSPRNSFSNLKQYYLAVLGLGALLSSPT